MRSLLIVAVIFLSACVSEPLPDGFKSSDDFDSVAAAKNRISLGLTYLKNGNFSQAKFNLDKALQFAPRLADAHFSMAYYYQQVDEIALADEAYQKAIAFEPRNPDIANSYGAFLCENGQYAEAKTYFLKAVNSANYISTAETYENLALCSQSQGEIEDALTYLQSSLSHQPSRAKALQLLVELQIQQQQWEEAKVNLRRLEKNSRVTPDTLWKSIVIEKALHNDDLARGYGDMLISMYPTHPTTLEYINSRRTKSSLENKQKVIKQLSPATDKIVNQVSQAPAKVNDQNLNSENSDSKNNQQNDEVAVVTKQSVVSDQNPQYHVVQQGENLYRISLKYNVKMQRLMDWNELTDASSIYVGKKLIVIDPRTVEQK